MIYSEYGKTLFKKLKVIRGIARENIQHAQSSQKKQHDKTSRPVSIEIGDTVFVQTQRKFKLDQNFHGPFRVHEVTGTNVKVKPVTNPDVESRTLSLQQVSKCKGSFATDQSWLGHNITKPRKQRKVRKRNPRNSTCSANPDLEQTSSPGYRTQYGRTVRPFKGREMKDNDLLKHYYVTDAIQFCTYMRLVYCAWWHCL